MNAILDKLSQNIPYCNFMGISFTLDENQKVLGKMPYTEHIIGNPILPALHGGGIAGFMEATALSSLIWLKAQEDEEIAFRHFPKTINITSDYLRPGLSKDSFAQASIHRVGGRFASLHVLAWQDDAEKPVAEAVCHFLVADWKRS